MGSESKDVLRKVLEVQDVSWRKDLRLSKTVNKEIILQRKGFIHKYKDRGGTLIFKVSISLVQINKHGDST